MLDVSRKIGVDIHKKGRKHMQELYLLLWSYVIGASMAAWLLCYLATGRDLRKLGSGNVGASNLKRVKGCENLYVPAVVFDAFKGFVAIMLARHYGYGYSFQALCGFMVIAGHRYPFWLTFQGGKGVATFLGVAAALWWPFALVALAFFALLKKKSGYTSLASVAAAFLFTAMFAIGIGWGNSGWVWATFALVLWGHILNLNLIKLGYEPNSKKGRPCLQYGFVVHPTTDDPTYLKDYFVKKSPRLAFLPYWFFNSLLAPLLFLIYPAAFVREAMFWNRVDGREDWRKPSQGLIPPVPIDPSFMMRHQQFALWAISRMIRLGAMAGATHAGLGAYTAIVGNRGQVLRDRFHGRIHITTGNDYTAWIGVGSLNLACQKMGKDIKDCVLLVIGTGGVGSVAAMLAAELLPIRKIILYNRTLQRAAICQQQIHITHPDLDVVVASDLNEALSEADLIISATSSATELEIDETTLRPGAIVCDIARPRDFKVSREDVLVYDGGLVECKNANLPSILGLPEDMSFACLFQTQALAEAGETKYLGGVGGKYDLLEVLHIAKICNSRSDGTGALRTGDGGAITDKQIEHIKQAAAKAACRIRRLS
ncbi:hypothetical protein COT77_00320 [Candidatus Berkelbacteria bacterium CG10_big_fil_rev_8_21_14_0_10_41_12]|uniref:Glycerol-3-phosphate acyltransferase n=1 Tax=Candidatus Berkelbacteria bacterium CG10_big_fil_rev_8_21_14_0_10_41_12 TaxID=1974513 RepID=A0A2M6WXY9_9BACT|nr:MAG: hypothetical protein COT77_00320 [Candidatus Berkelbacteria bacterium CG10_big_fil_rev_8_21_14_0_10_41_12]